MVITVIEDGIEGDIPDMVVGQGTAIEGAPITEGGITNVI